MPSVFLGAERIIEPIYRSQGTLIFSLMFAVCPQMFAITIPLPLVSSQKLYLYVCISAGNVHYARF